MTGPQTSDEKTVSISRVGERDRARSGAPNEPNWRDEIDGALDLLGDLATRVREGAGPENLAASLALTCANLERRIRRSALETKATPEGVLQWAVDSFGPIARNRDERAARLAEEAMEVAQAEGVPLDTLKRIADRIYSRPVGELGQEIGGLGITLYALSANCDIDLFREIEREWRRVLSKPRDWWQRKHAEKVSAGTADLSPVETTGNTKHA